MSTEPVATPNPAPFVPGDYAVLTMPGVPPYMCQVLVVESPTTYVVTGPLGPCIVDASRLSAIPTHPSVAQLARDFDPFDDTWSEAERKAGERALELFARKMEGWR